MTTWTTPFPGEKVAIPAQPPSVTVSIRGREYVVPSLTSGEYVRLDKEGFFSRESPSLAQVVADQLFIVGLALRHNYPDLKAEDVETFSPTELAQLMKAVTRATLGAPDPEAQSPATETAPGPTT